jgi:Holliday junction resolvase RusA-like endonuclease
MELSGRNGEGDGEGWMTWLPVAEFFVTGEPKAQPRVRVTKTGHAYTPGSAKGFKERVHWEARANIDVIEWDEPEQGDCLRVDIDFFLKRPKRLCRKADPDGPVYAPKKPDKDNLEKAVLDALVGANVLWDDAQVVSGTVQKFYHAKDKGPGAMIKISRWKE